jgi:nucleotide-binding universal stress UspA family protein
MNRMERIVVGVDGSTNAEVALRWALGEAELHGAEVVAVMAWDYLNQYHADGTGFDSSYGSDQAREALHAAVQAVEPSRPVVERVVLDLPAQALIDVGAEADLLVTGARGLGGFKGLLLGSVSERVLEQAPCPVAVLRENDTWSADGRVVVGIDASATATSALRWAAGEAQVREAVLHFVHAWQLPPAPLWSRVPPAGAQFLHVLEDAAHGVVEAALRDPAVVGLHVEGHVLSSSPAQALLEFADEASLIVVGSRGAGRFARALLGSTSRQLAHHAGCPIVVVPAGTGRS